MQMFTTQTRFRLHTNISRNINSHQPSRLRFLLRLLPISLLFFFASLFDAFLDRFLVDLPPQLGSQNGAKMSNKSIPKSIFFLMPVGIDFWMDFGGFLVPMDPTVWTEFGGFLVPMKSSWYQTGSKHRY